MNVLLRAARTTTGLLWLMLGVACSQQGETSRQPFDREDALVIATRAEPNSIDPQFSAVGSNQATAMHMFDTLFARDEELRMVPSLALSAERIDPLTWELVLREGVLFHDGSAFDAQDVVFSLHRAAHVPFSPASFAKRVSKIARVSVPEPMRVRLHTIKPEPQLLVDVSKVFIVSGKLGAELATNDFNTGRVAIGTGPYRFVDWARGDRLVLERNEHYWGKPPAYGRVVIRYITSDATRIAALRSGSVDLIDTVPPSDLDHLRRNAGIRLWQAPTVTLLYLGLDVDRDENPSVRTRKGKPGGINPFKDVRVREALSLAIDRPLMIEKILSGSGAAANQMVPAGITGHNHAMEPMAFDPERARRLLTEAGYPEGFEVTLHAPNNRYLNDAQVAQAIGVMLARIGLGVRIDAVPKNVFLPRATKREYGLYLYGFGATTGESSLAMRSVLGTYNPEDGSGSSNRGRYSNAHLDRLLQSAAQMESGPALDRQLELAAAVGFSEFGIVPLYHQVATWGGRPDLEFIPRRDERTLAQNVMRGREAPRRALAPP